MTRMRWLIVSFWIFIIGMLLWQFINYNSKLDKATVEHPDPKHYFFYDTKIGQQTAPVVSKISGPSVQQKSFTTELGKPDANSFTCHVTLKNMGDAKAVNVQINVRPFRGVMLSGGEISPVNQTQPVIVQDNDSLGLISKWVAFPDLAPGESKTQDVVFDRRPEVDPGDNPNPNVMFAPEKANP